MFVDEIHVVKETGCASACRDDSSFHNETLLQELLLQFSEGFLPIFRKKIIDGNFELVFKAFINVVKGVMQMVGKFLTQGGFSAPHKADEIDSHIKKALLPGWTEAQSNEL